MWDEWEEEEKETGERANVQTRHQAATSVFSLWAPQTETNTAKALIEIMLLASAVETETMQKYRAYKSEESDESLEYLHCDVY